MGARRFDFGVFRESVATFADDNDTKLERKNLDWADGSLFLTISFLPVKGEFTFRTAGIQLEELLVLCAMYTQGIELMDPAVVKDMTGHSLNRIRQLARLVAE